MLDRVLGRRPDLVLRFEQRECVIVPQTATRIAIHADVHFVFSSARAASIDDAALIWEHDGPRGRRVTFRRSRWDRAVVEGRFRYPPQRLAVEAGPEAREVTLTFTDALIPHGPEAPPPLSVLSLELTLGGVSRPLRRELWRVRLTSWDVAGEVTWTAGSGA